MNDDNEKKGQGPRADKPKAVEAVENPVRLVRSETEYDYRRLFAPPARHDSIASILAAGSAGLLTGSLMSAPPELEAEIRSMRGQLSGALKQLTAARSDVEQEKTARLNAEKIARALTEKEQLAFLLNRVSKDAREALLASEALRRPFLDTETAQPLYAMSVDIRRSTELMLKAREPKAFAEFITDLCEALTAVVLDHHGVVDKFTGDGILCFFPEFFSGPDAGYLAVAAADACHKTFATRYQQARPYFESVLRNVGLGIGIDYGMCNLVQVAGSLTIVGRPVVYACRFGGAPAGTTLVNQPAYQKLCAEHGARVALHETAIEIKHEGELVAHAAKLHPTSYTARPPAWRAATTTAADRG